MQNLTEFQKEAIERGLFKTGDNKLYFRAPRGVIIRLTEKPPTKKQRNKLRKTIYKELLRAERERIGSGEYEK